MTYVTMYAGESMYVVVCMRVDMSVADPSRVRSYVGLFWLDGCDPVKHDPQ